MKYTQNNMSKALITLGIIIMIILFVWGLIAGTAATGYYGPNVILWSVVLTYWIIGAVFGMILIGLGEILKLLNQLYHEHYYTNHNTYPPSSDTTQEAAPEDFKWSDELLLELRSQNNSTHLGSEDRLKTNISRNYSTDGKRILDILPLPVKPYYLVILEEDVHMVYVVNNLPLRIEAQNIKDHPELHQWYMTNRQ